MFGITVRRVHYSGCWSDYWPMDSYSCLLKTYLLRCFVVAYMIRKGRYPGPGKLSVRFIRTGNEFSFICATDRRHSRDMCYYGLICTHCKGRTA